MFNKILSSLEKSKRLAEDVRREAYRLPAGRGRDELLRRASEIENACRAQQWMESPGLRPPAGSRKLEGGPTHFNAKSQS